MNTSFQGSAIRDERGKLLQIVGRYYIDGMPGKPGVVWQRLTDDEINDPSFWLN